MRKHPRQTGRCKKAKFSTEPQAYCAKCRKTRTVTDATVEEAANGRRMAQGTCPVCGTKVR